MLETVPAAAGLRAPRPDQHPAGADLAVRQSGDALRPPLRGEGLRGAGTGHPGRSAARPDRGRPEGAGPQGDARRAQGRAAPRRRWRPRAVFRFFKAGSRGQHPPPLRRRRPAPRRPPSSSPGRPRAGGVCLADFVRPLGPRESPATTSALFVVTAGKGIRELADALQGAGRLREDARGAGAGAGDGRGLRRAAPLPHPQHVGLPGSTGPHHAGAVSRRVLRASATRSATRPARGWRTSSSSSRC